MVPGSNPDSETPTRELDQAQGSELAAVDQKTTVPEVARQPLGRMSHTTQGMSGQRQDPHRCHLLSLSNAMLQTAPHLSNNTWHIPCKRLWDGGQVPISRAEGWSFKTLKFSTRGRSLKRYSEVKAFKGPHLEQVAHSVLSVILQPLASLTDLVLDQIVTIPAPHLPQKPCGQPGGGSFLLLHRNEKGQ